MDAPSPAARRRPRRAESQPGLPVLLGLLLVVVLPATLPCAAQTGPAAEPADRVDEAVRLRAGGDLEGAARLLAMQVVREREDIEAWRLLAQTLYWLGDFPAARERYRQALALRPDDVRLRLEYGRMLVELNDVRAAPGILAPLRHRRAVAAEAEALLGMLAYQQGDLARAAARLREALRHDPQHAAARRLLDEIRLMGAPSYALRAGYRRDSQPLELLQLEAGATWYLTPLQALELRARPSRFQLEATDQDVVLVDGSLAGYWPGPRLETQIAGGLVEHGLRQGPEWIGRASLGRRLSGSLRWRAAAERAPYLNTRASLALPTMVESLQGVLALQRRDGWLGEASFRADWYPDANRITSAYAWLLAPFVRSRSFELQLGPVLSWQDAVENRFEPLGGASATNGQPYPGRYSPYYTPEQLWTYSVAGALALRPAPMLALSLGGSYGVHAREQAPYFFAGSALAPQRGFYERRFHPYRAHGAATTVLSSALRLRVGGEHERTAFYRATSLELGMHWRRTRLPAAREQGGHGSGSPPTITVRGHALPCTSARCGAAALR